MYKHFLTAIVLLLMAACTPKTPENTTAEIDISRETLERHIAMLASDSFEGRAPSTEGEIRTIQYLKNEFATLGLAPGNAGSFFQEVPLVAVTSRPAEPLTVTSSLGNSALEYQVDYMAWTPKSDAQVSLDDSEMVFVGYGIVAPEYNWNDYEDLDVAGKTVVILVNDPGYATQNPNLFNGNAMTYYGRWTYKFEEAARQGAAGALVIHETGPAGYGWEVVSGGSNSRQIDVQRSGEIAELNMEGWISAEAMDKIANNAGNSLATLKEQALEESFNPVPLQTRLQLTFETQVEESISNNVIAMIPGKVRPEEYVFYMAHWDHLGVDPTLTGDQIYNGAYDNATGTAGLLAIAESIQNSGIEPERSIVFLAVTAEESGLLGSAYYGQNPVFPVNKTVSAINMDVLNMHGKMRDITVIGYGNSELDQYVTVAAKSQGRTVRTDPTRERGYFYRSDHFSFAKEGIPAIYTDPGVDHVEFGEEYSHRKEEEYRLQRYHQPSDEYDPENWDFSGAIQDLQLLYHVGMMLADTTDFPQWNEGNEFRAKREAQMKSN